MIARPKLPSTVFESRGTKTKWPTLRGAYITPENLPLIKRLSDGVILFEGMYNTRLNMYAKKAPEEFAVFFEHSFTKPTVQKPHNYKKSYALTWIGNYYNGAVFHTAFQYPQALYYSPRDLEIVAYRLYRRVVKYLYGDSPLDSEVEEFLETQSKTGVR